MRRQCLVDDSGDPLHHQPQSEVEQKIVKHRLFAYCSDDEELLHDARITHSWKRQCQWEEEINVSNP